MGAEPRRPASLRSLRGLRRVISVASSVWLALSLSLIPSGSLGAPACSLVPLLREVTINQGLGSYPKLVQGKETLVRAYLSKPSCATTASAIRITGGTLTVRAGALTSTVQAPFPAQVTPYPLISPHYRTTPPVDSPGDPKWVVPGSFLNPTGTAGFTATFSIVVTYQSAANGTTFGATQSVSFTSSSKAVERETNPLRVLVVPVGDATVNFASQYSAAANEQVQLAMQTISRIFPVADGTGELNATTGGVRFTVLPTLIDIRAVLDTDGLYCLRGSSFDVPIKGQLQTLAQQWETENPGIQIDVAVAVIDPAISKGGSCAQGMAVAGSSYTSAAGLAVARMTPDQGGAILAMEIAHALGLVPAGRGRAGDPSHSPVTAADAGTNRGYNVRDRSFLADDRTALYNSGTGFTNTSTLIEQLDYQFLLCALGGATTSDCANPGLIGNNLPSGPRFVMSGTVAPDGLSVGNIVVAYSSNVPGTPPANSGPFTLSQINVPASGPTQVLRTDFVRVSFGGTHHEDGPHNAGVVDVAVPFNADADRIEFRNGSTVLQSFVASEVPELVSFQVVPAGESNYTGSSVDDASPTVSPDGQWVAWTTVPDEGFSRIHVGPIGNSDDAVEYSEISSELDGQSQYDPAWRFDGAALAFISDGDLYTIGVDPATGSPLTDTLTLVSAYDEIDGAGLFASHPTWSPDGTQLAFDADGAIFVINATDGATGTETQLTFTGDASYPSWSQTDGDNRIAYERNPPSDISSIATLAQEVRPPELDRLGFASHGGTHFIVTSVDDANDGTCDATHCSLREALLAANGNLNESPTVPDRIDFAVGNGLITISPTSPLPTITEAVIVDGFSQPGVFVNTEPPHVELDGSQVGATPSNGLTISSGGSLIQGLIVNGFTQSGIRLETGDGNVIRGNYIGTDALGQLDRGNTSAGIEIFESAGNTIGGTGLIPGEFNAAEANFISGNDGTGIFIGLGAEAADNVIVGNFVGLASNATSALGNGYAGIVVSAPRTTIGGTEPGTRNVISANSIGIYLGLNSNSEVNDNVVQGNYIGTDHTGTLDRGNTTMGVLVGGDTGNIIGGSDPGAGNVISGNDASGIEISSAVVNDTLVQGNLIGVGPDGTVPDSGSIGNGFAGVYVRSVAANTRIGGSGAGEGNVISDNFSGVWAEGAGETFVEGNKIGVEADGVTPAGNTFDGIRVSFNSAKTHIGLGLDGSGAANTIAANGGNAVEIADGSGNDIIGNRIEGNDDISIDLTGDGPTPNDPLDGDSGANDLINYPLITTATTDGNVTMIGGTIEAEPATVARLDVYSSDGCDEGATYLGTTSIVADFVDGTGSWSLTSASDESGRQITATMSDNFGNTSEFSPCVLVGVDTESFTVNTTDDHDLPGGCTVSDCALREAINASNATSGVDTITFDIAGPGPHVIEVSSESPLPAITDPVVVDGTSEPDYPLGGPPVIELDGSVTQDGVNGLVLQAGDSTIRGLSIVGFPADGIHITGSDNTIVANQIGANGGSGIVVEGASGTLIEGNGIGTNANGTLDIGNGGDGITMIDDITNGIIGGTSPDSPNRIKFNDGDGIGIDDSSSGIEIRVNLMDENGGLGIDLSQDNEVRFNDLGDGDPPDTDTGANGLQNYPYLDVSGDGTLISGTLISTPDTDFEVDIFVSPVCDESGNGEGASFAGSVSVSTNQFGYGVFDLAPDGPVGPTEVATATATGPEGTSEFSFCESAALNSDEIWTLDPSDPTNTQEQLVEDAVEPSWGTAGAIAFARDGDIYTIGSDGSGETQLTDLGLDSMPSLGGVPAFVRFVDDDSGTQDDVFLLLDDFNVLVTAADDHPELVRLDLIYSCPGSPNYDVAVGLVPTAVTAASASWAANFDGSLACPNGTLRPVLTDFWNRTAPTGFDRQITSEPQPPVAAIYVPEVGDTLLQWNALALHGSGKDADDGELLGSSLRWFINGTEIVNYSASCGVTRSHCDIQPPGGAWPLPTGQNSTPLTVRLEVTDSDGDTHSDEVTIQVLRDADEDGIPATVEATCGLSDGDARDSFTDGDNDLYLAQDDYALGGSPCVAATSYPAIVKFSPSTLFVPSSGSAVSMSVQLPLRDIRTVLPSTVKLQLISGAVVAIPNIGWSVDNKGVGTAKFDRQAVIQKLQQLGLTNSMVRYTIVGTSSQGWSFEGTDTQQAKPAN